MASTEHRPTKAGIDRWRVVWRQDGEKQQATFQTETAASAFRLRVEAYANRWPPNEDPRPNRATAVLTFGDWAKTAIGHRTRASERTKADYLRDLDNHMGLLLPMDIDGIGDPEVTRWLADLAGKGLAGKTVRNLHGFASSLYVDALAQHPPVASHNPFAKKLGEVASVRTEDMVFLTPQEFDLVVTHVRDEYRALVRFLYATGLRYGEATALDVRDVNLMAKRKTVTVTKAQKRTGPATWEIGEPKTPRSRRTVSLSPELVELLIPLVASRPGTDLLFPGAGGGRERLPHVEVYKRGWAPAVARAMVCTDCYLPQRDGRNQTPRLPKPCTHPGVLDKRPRIHDLRHSHVSWLISEGIALPVISRRLGHSSITITMDRYGHLDPSLDDAVDAAVDKALARR